MINTMRELALSELNHRFSNENFAEMSELRQYHAAEILPLLVEDTGKVQRVYVLTPTSTEHEIQMKVFEIGSESALPEYLPFVKPSGSQSPAIGPLLKRTYKPKVRPPYGPTAKILASTLKGFQTQAATPSLWQTYFQDIVQILSNAKVLYFNDNSYPRGDNQSLLEIAVAAIPQEEKETVFLTVLDNQGLFPGQKQEYLDYLKRELASLKYVTTATPVHDNSTCPLCATPNTPIYPNAVKGAGINIGNVDRAGYFAGMNKAKAWKNYGLCFDCADLLYIFKNHILPKFLGKVAGEDALILPSLLGTEIESADFMEEWHKYLAQTQTKALKKSVERDILEFFKEQDDAHLLIQIIWASFGQNMEEVNGYITDILPSRLSQLSALNAQANNKWQHALFPKYLLDEAAFDLPLNMLWHLLKRRGGKEAKNANASKQFRELRHQLAASIYHANQLSDNGIHLWNEIMTTARYYLIDVLKRGDTYGLCYEGYNKKKHTKYWTLAGWIRHLARFIHYLNQNGVLKNMTNTRTFEPKMPQLQALFADGAGINSNDKAFAFLVGILYGKLLQVQSGKEVNIISSTIPWLKRLQLSGKDLPELYAKICHKFLIYGATSKETQQVIRETAQVGKIVGDDIKLDVTKTGYFLLLGQALAVEILPTKSNEEKTK